MGKIVNKYDYRVIVWPRSLGNFGFVSMSDSMIEPDEEKRNKRYLEICKEIEDNIKRHIDNVDNIVITHDVDELCEHCGYAWEVDSDGIPMCCDEAINEHNNLTP